MKKMIALALVLICILSFSSCANNSSKTVSFHNRTFQKADLSEETLEWLEWYNALPEAEQLAINYIPAELGGHREASVAETE